MFLLVAALSILSRAQCSGADQLQSALAYAKDHQKVFNEQLMDLIAIPSISALPGQNIALHADVPQSHMDSFAITGNCTCINVSICWC